MSLKLVFTRNFTPLFLTQFLGALNDNFFKNALIIIVTYRGMQVAGMEPNMVVALAGGVFIVPFFLFSGTAGQLADKLEKSRLIRLTKWLELVIMSLAVTGFYLEQFGLLLGVLFLMGMQSALFGPLKYGILPDLVGERELVSANAYVETGTFIAILVGTIGGGLATQFQNGVWVLSMALLIVAGLGIVASRFIPGVPVRTPDLPVDWTFVQSTWSILRTVAKQRTIFNAILGISWFWFLGAAVLTILPGFVKDVIQGNEQVLTLLLALFTIGIGAGSLLCEKLSFNRVEVGIIPFGAVGMSLFMVDLYFAGGFWERSVAPTGLVSLAEFAANPAGMRIMGDLLMTAICGGIFIVPLYSFIQYRGDPAYLSRIIAANNILNALYLVGAALLVMALLALDFTFLHIFLITAGLNLIASVVIYTVVPEFTLRFLGWIIAHVVYRIRVQGAENIPAEGPLVLTCNHVSFVDWLIITSECKRPVRFVMDYRIFTIPVVSMIFRHGKVIPIAPAKENPKMMEAAFAKVSEELKEAEVVGIFPEGQLSRDGKMTYFRPGVERIIKADPSPVVPMALHGLWGSMLSHSREKGLLNALKSWRREVELHIGPPLPPKTATAQNLENAVRKLLDQATAAARETAK